MPHAINPTVPILATLLALPAGLLVLPAALAAQAPIERLQAEDPAAGDLFGCALDLDGARLLAGSLLDDDRGADSGSAYVFELGPEGWRQTAKLIAGATGPGDQLGFSVALADDLAVLGAPLAPGGGSVHYFRNLDGVWVEVGSDGAEEAGAGLGTSVAIAPGGGRVAFGAPTADVGGATDAGVVFLAAPFGAQGDRPGGRQRVTAGAPASGDAFGWSLALAGGLLAVGAPYADAPGTNAGAVHLFQVGGGGGAELARLTAPAGSPFDAFGYSVSLDGGLLAVGAPAADPAGSSSGAVYLFRRTSEAPGFALEAVLPGAAPGDHFGVSVSLGGGLLAVGAERAGGIGAVHLFRRVEGAWVEVERLRPGSASPGDGVGIAVDLSGAQAEAGLAFGAFRDDTGGADAGSLYVRAPLPPSDADLRVSVSLAGGAPATPGVREAFTVTVVNDGPDDLTGVRVEAPPDPLLTGVRWTCTGAGGGSCTARGSGGVDDSADLPVGGSVSYRLTGDVPSSAAGTLTQAAEAVAPAGVTDPSPGDASASLVVPLAPVADLFFALAALVPGGFPARDLARRQGRAAVPGEEITHTITLANAGPSDLGRTLNFGGGALGPAFVDPQWTCAASGGGDCDVEDNADGDPDPPRGSAGSGFPSGAIDLPAGGRVVFTLVSGISPSATGELVLRGGLGPFAGLDPDPSNNQDEVVTPLFPVSDVAVALSVAPASVVPGGVLTLTVTVTNGGPSDAAAVRVTALPPPGLTAGAWTCAPGPGASCLGGTGALVDRAAIPAGSLVVYTATMTAQSDFFGPVEVSAEAAPEIRIADPDPSNDRATVTGVAFPPAGTVGAKMSVSGAFHEGGVVTYTIVLVSSFPVALPDAPGSDELVDVLPAEIEVLSAETDAPDGVVQTTPVPSGTVTWNGPLAPGEVVTVTIRGKIRPNTFGSVVANQAEVTFFDEGNNLVVEGETSPQGEPQGPTVFTVGGALDIPSLSPWGLGMLALLVTVAALGLLGSWRTI